MAIAVVLVDLDRRVRALAGSVGECAVDEAGLEDGLDDGAQRVVHDSVTKRSCRDQSALGIVNLDLDVSAGSIRAI